MFRVLTGFLRFETFTMFECFEYVEILLSSELLETLSLCCRQKKIKFLRDKENSIRFFNCQKSTTIFRPSFSIFLHLLCSSARKTVHWHWFANNFRFSERQLRRQLIFLCEKKEIWFFSQFREDYTFNSRTSRRLVGSDTSARVANCARQFCHFRHARVLEIR